MFSIEDFYARNKENKLPNFKYERLSFNDFDSRDPSMLTLVQKTSQVLLHMAVAFAVTYGFTGSWAVGGIAALIEPICNVLLLPLHDRVWLGIRRHIARRGQRARTAAVTKGAAIRAGAA